MSNRRDEEGHVRCDLDPAEADVIAEVHVIQGNGNFDGDNNNRGQQITDGH